MKTRDKIDSHRASRGFTLTELLVVMLVIGIMLAFLLIAAQDGVRRAQERATQALVAKLELGMNDRLDAILSQQAQIALGHRQMAAIYFSNGSIQPSEERAKVIATFDRLRAEVPDVFFVQRNSFSDRYPLNFAGAPYPYVNNPTIANFVLPLGEGAIGYGTGIFGASYTAAAGIYKNLGYSSLGYNGADDDGNGLIDEYAEGISGLSGQQVNLIQQRLANHTHKTARSEMLYALLVDGEGPLGSVFSRDEFSSTEVADTDDDGLPEFVDAWGEPLQFYRWPTHYNPASSYAGPSPTYLQKGRDPYFVSQNFASPEPRQRDPLDQGQLLIAPSWWWSQVNSITNFPPGFNVIGRTGQVSAPAVAFMNYFHTITESNPSQGASNPFWWDRNGFLERRAYFSKFLIISPGPDKQLGIAQFNTDYPSISSEITDGTGRLVNITTGASPAVNLNVTLQDVRNLILVENQAGQFDPNRQGAFLQFEPRAGSNLTSVFLYESGHDDISNHNGGASGGGGQ